MEYKIEEIGAAFTNKGIKNLEEILNNRYKNEGWEFHSVINITKPGCLGSGGENSYIAVFTREQKKHDFMENA